MNTEEKKEGPQCVGVVMDGNRRWSKERGIDTLEGHTQGHKAFTNIVRAVRDAHIPHAIFYAFSSENWSRPSREVEYLMKLLHKVIAELMEGVEEERVAVRFVGEMARLPEETQKIARELEEKSAEYTNTTIWVAISYTGRLEIVDAVNRAVAKGESVTEASFNELLWTAGMPDPDMIIRTSGERRLSGFLPWQSVYSEFFFVDTYWPDFTPEDFNTILEEFGERKRRRGK